MSNVYLVNGESLTNIADEIKELIGDQEPLSLPEMKEALKNSNDANKESIELIKSINQAVTGENIENNESSSYAISSSLASLYDKINDLPFEINTLTPISELTPCSINNEQLKPIQIMANPVSKTFKGYIFTNETGVMSEVNYFDKFSFSATGGIAFSLDNIEVMTSGSDKEIESTFIESYDITQVSGDDLLQINFALPVIPKSLRVPLSKLSIGTGTSTWTGETKISCYSIGVSGEITFTIPKPSDLATLHSITFVGERFTTALGYSVTPNITFDDSIYISGETSICYVKGWQMTYNGFSGYTARQVYPMRFTANDDTIACTIQLTKNGLLNPETIISQPELPYAVDFGKFTYEITGTKGNGGSGTSTISRFEIVPNISFSVDVSGEFDEFNLSSISDNPESIVSIFGYADKSFIAQNRSTGEEFDESYSFVPSFVAFPNSRVCGSGYMPFRRQTAPGFDDTWVNQIITSGTDSSFLISSGSHHIQNNLTLDGYAPGEYQASRTFTLYVVYK